MWPDGHRGACIDHLAVSLFEDGKADRKERGMNPEEIVRNLAEQPAPVASDNGFTSKAGTYCLHCPAEHPTQQPQDHDVTCPWRMAREWVAQNPS